MFNLKSLLSKILNNTHTTNLNMLSALNGLWIVRVYSNGGASVSGYPTPTELAANSPYSMFIMSPIKNIFTEGTNYEPWGLYNYYTAWYRCYAYAENSITITNTVNHDDQASFFVNDIKIADIGGTAATAVTFTLNKGWNSIDLIYTENSGAASGYLSTNLEKQCKYVLPFKIEDNI